MMLGKYQLVSKLASGGMAEVYLARAEGPMGFAKSLVVKRILPHLAEDPQFVEMFISEARLAAQLDHPHIVQIFDFGEVDGTWYLAMEFIDGLNLRVLARHAKITGMLLPPSYCARIIAHACDGLAFAHDSKDAITGAPLGLIHRDISPDNILLSRQGAVKVVDFGIAKAAGQGHRTESGVLKGKIAYMTPEQLRNMALDRRVDVYALGIVLYELLTGYKPFDTTSEASIVHAILHEPFVPAVERRPDLPAAMGRILERALAKDREQRYPDCRTLQADLEGFILSAGEPVGAWNLAQLVARVMATSASPEAKLVSANEPEKTTPARKTPEKTTPARKTPETAIPERTTPETTTPETAIPERTTPETTTPETAIPERTTPETTTPETAIPETTTPARPAKPTLEIRPVGNAQTGRRGSWTGRIAAGVGAAVLIALAVGIVMRDEAPANARPEVTGPTTPVPLSEAPVPKEVGGPAPSESPAPARDEPPPEPTDKTPVPESSEPPVVAQMSPEASAPERPKPSRGSRARATPPETSVRMGTVEFRIWPYATVWLDGKRLGETPLAPVDLSAGRHTVKLLNEELGKNVTQQIEVRAGETFVFKYNLRAE
ncbi:protein kinase [Archangium minus]|uniref:Protein kinase n=1 Tax=Archangium minus TaxID=83450 RepID=A0ABY9WQ83_9BACT|nr:protein kinase [Archangium minus]